MNACYSTARNRPNVSPSLSSIKSACAVLASIPNKVALANYVLPRFDIGFSFGFAQKGMISDRLLHRLLRGAMSAF